MEENVLCNVVILQTVLEEVRHRSSNVYKKLKDIIINPSRKFYIFVNEHHKDTFVERVRGEKVNDRNDRAIRVSAEWYNTHLALSSKTNSIKTILITDDADNKTIARNNGLDAFTSKKEKEYFNLKLIYIMMRIK